MLEDGKKHRSVSVTGTVGKTAFALCLCFMDMPDGSMAGQAKEFKRLFKEVTGFDFDQLVIRVVADGGADGVAKELKKDGKHCSMHKFQLVAKEGIGKSGKTKALMGMGPFEEGNELSVHVNDLSTHFSRCAPLFSFASPKPQKPDQYLFFKRACACTRTKRLKKRRCLFVLF